MINLAGYASLDLTVTPVVNNVNAPSENQKNCVFTSFFKHEGEKEVL